MNDEFRARQRAIALCLAGRPVLPICRALGRTEAWFHKWWRRYLDFGAECLFDLTRARHIAQGIPPELERGILSVRRRLQAHASPATRYSLIGAAAILTELGALGFRLLPSPCTIERVRERYGLTAPGTFYQVIGYVEQAELRLEGDRPDQPRPGREPASRPAGERKGK